MIGFFYAIISKFPLYKVSDASMSPNFEKGNLTLTTNLFNKESIKPNDVYILGYEDEVYLSRIVAVPGDKIEIIDAVLYLNDNEVKSIKSKFKTKIVADSMFYEWYGEKYSIPKPNSFGECEVNLTNKEYYELEKNEFIKSIQKIIHPKAYQYTFQTFPIFPNNVLFNWSRDNFGPLLIPKKGDSIKLSPRNLALYKKLIEVDEANQLQMDGNTFFINNKLALSYTFTKNYYWIMSDNRHHSKDSRYWGFFSEDHLIGKLTHVIYNPNEKN